MNRKRLAKLIRIFIFILNIPILAPFLLFGYISEIIYKILLYVAKGWIIISTFLYDIADFHVNKTLRKQCEYLTKLVIK